MIKVYLSYLDSLLLSEPVHMKIQLEGSLIWVVVALKIFFKKICDIIDVVVITSVGKDTLIRVMASIVLIPERVYRDFPQTRICFGRTLQGSAQKRRLTANSVSLIVFNDSLLLLRNSFLLFVFFGVSSLSRTVLPDIWATNVVPVRTLLLFFGLLIVRALKGLSVVPREGPERRRTFWCDNTGVVEKSKIVSHFEHRIATFCTEFHFRFLFEAIHTKPGLIYGALIPIRLSRLSAGLDDDPAELAKIISLIPIISSAQSL